MASTREGWRRARFETVLDLSLALAGPRREGEVVEELAHRAVGLLDARAGVALSLLPDLRPAAVVGVGWPGEPGSVAAWLSSPQLGAVRAGDTVRLPGAAIGLPFEEVLIAPCLWRDELTGVVCVADREARGGQVAFDEEDERFLRSLALLAAPAIAAGRQLEEAERRRLVLEEENRTLRFGGGEDVGLVGQAPAFRRVIELARRVAASDVTVLVRGESGTGKERVARLLHSLSGRRLGPFVPLNCAAVPESLLEAELFGIEKGVATGVAARAGKLELANGGTLFLDEVGDLTPHLQAKLLRVVQEREVERVGGRQRLRVDVRLVAATNRDVEAMMERGEFREDLYYRLRVVELVLPPLRQRREDIPLLASYFVRLHGQRLGRGELRLSRGALELLLAHDYPGNVRELENLIEAAVALADGPFIERADVELAVGRRPAAPAAAAGGSLDDVVRAHVLATLERCQGCRGEAARELGIDRSTLYRMLVRWNASSGAIRTVGTANTAKKSIACHGKRRS
ncbi:MAG TPA: sigma-54 dependent transcriptional regulator [Thermoanaerobaculaceae bacterium]|nr:sigma-54 dependent transcriptional regulator [Thermoanaerobaculaceae bacterium]HRS15823.1 sigma-54 dependent transcriptional regulator [Thermoanaerobaculaceae bacterium]